MSRLVAGVVGNPVRHSLSPMIHAAWIEASGIDGVYNRFEIEPDGFREFVDGLRGGRVRGLNVTIPFKEEALDAADEADTAAMKSGAANLLLFAGDGRVVARNTDGIGLMAAFAEQAPDFKVAAGPIVIVGAGGAARGAAAALVAAGAPRVRIVNRTYERAAALAAALGDPVVPVSWDQLETALNGATAIINATSLGLNGKGDLDLPLDAAPPEAVVMDMVYKPLRTGLLKAAAAQGHPTVDGLAMLIGQARPSFEAFYGRPAPTDTDVRGLCLEALGEAP